MGHTPWKVLSIKVPPDVSARVAKLAKARHVTVSEVVREAIAQLEAAPKGSFLEAAGDLAGIVKKGPRDLATHARHLKGFGDH